MMPAWGMASMALSTLPGNCGPMSVWFLLRQHGKRVSAARIIRACRHTKLNGCYTITLALALHEFGLPVSFHTDPDPAIEPQEARCYERAQRCGMPVKPAVSLSMLLRLTRLRPAIVYYAGLGGGHFSPLVGFRWG